MIATMWRGDAAVQCNACGAMRVKAAMVDAVHTVSAQYSTDVRQLRHRSALHRHISRKLKLGM